MVTYLCLHNSVTIATYLLPEADLRIRALSAADGGGPSVAKKKSILVDPKQISLVSKSEKEKKNISGPPPPVSLLCHWGPSTYLLAQLFLRGGGANLLDGALQTIF